VLGTMTMGPEIGSKHMDGKYTTMPMHCQTPPDVAEAQLRAFAATAQVMGGPEAGKVLLDTATIYQNGYTESTLGQIFRADPALRSRFSIHTKVNSAIKPHMSLSSESVLAQVDASLERLGIECIDLLYLHSPDIKTPIVETLDAIQKLHEAGKINEFGLSNYPAWKVVDIYYRCKDRGMVLPTVYQGCYNAITRSVEFEATPAFRELGIRSYHYNPLAGGLLTGKYASIEDPRQAEGRFGTGSPISGTVYSERYWKAEIFHGLQVVRAACEGSQIPMAEAALRWLMHHSVLSPSHHDGIILGASSLEHINANLAACAKGPLPEALASAFDEAWAHTRQVSDGYFRGYGKAAGSADTFLKMHQEVVPASAV